MPFSFPLPWETPLTELYGQGLGIALGVRTELGVAGSRDKGDMDPLAVRPLPAQEAILEAFGQLGFGFKTADLELGHIGGTGRRLPFYQEIELAPSPRYADQVNEIEVTFLADPAGLDVVLEADKRGGFFSEGRDALTRFTVSHHGVEQVDWNAEVDDWLRRLIDHRASYGTHGAPTHGGALFAQGGHDPYGGCGRKDDYGHGHHGDGHHSGPGMGTAIAARAAGLAVGVAGGMVAAEIVDEVGDFFEGDDEGDEGDEG